MNRDVRTADRAAEVRREADEIAAEYGDASLGAPADELDRKAEAYDGGPELARAVAAELRRRAAVGVRAWPGPIPLPPGEPTTR